MGNNSVPKFIFRLPRFPVYRGSVVGRFYCIPALNLVVWSIHYRSPSSSSSQRIWCMSQEIQVVLTQFMLLVASCCIHTGKGRVLLQVNSLLFFPETPLKVASLLRHYGNGTHSPCPRRTDGLLQPPRVTARSFLQFTNGSQFPSTHQSTL